MLNVINIFLINIFQVVLSEEIISSFLFLRIRVIVCPFLQYLSIGIEITIVITKFYSYYFILHIKTHKFWAISHWVKAFFFLYISYTDSGEYHNWSYFCVICYWFVNLLLVAEEMIYKSTKLKWELLTYQHMTFCYLFLEVIYSLNIQNDSIGKRLICMLVIITSNS